MKRRALLAAALAAPFARLPVAEAAGITVHTPLWATKSREEILADINAVILKIREDSQAMRVIEFKSVEEVNHYFGAFHQSHS